ncbi:MAG: TIGR02452 family protein, partial [Candidatus Spyradocola sp.]
MDNIAMLWDTLDICRRGSYVRDGRSVYLKLSPDEMRRARVFLPDEVAGLMPRRAQGAGRCGYSCRNMDAFRLARIRSAACAQSAAAGDPREVLVLNLANPVHPGGGVRRGARAQEEDLCRKSTLLLSLEGAQAAGYYEYNRSLHTLMGSDAIVITPRVEIIRDENGELLDESAVVAVMTCAAPCLREGMEGLTRQQYRDMLRGRIDGMLRCAAHLGYRYLVLGAFGCGAFGNDAALVSDLFREALDAFDVSGMKTDDVFRQIDFAVLCRDAVQYNYREFYRNFGDDSPLPDETAAPAQGGRPTLADSIRGSLLGGAVGDALGYAVEFSPLEQIRKRYGDSGITAYDPGPATGKALISDDTQMTLFTACGILTAETQAHRTGSARPLHAYVRDAYDDWLTTQYRDASPGGRCWLLDVPELHSRRAPGNTCLSALAAHRERGGIEDFMENPLNHSKGCGGVMRIAPLGVHCADMPAEELDRQAVLLTALTHGHPLGWLPSAVLTHILHRIVFGEQSAPLKVIVAEARDAVCARHADDPHVGALRGIIDKAIALSENRDADSVNIERIGEGWVAEETLAIALYCALRHEHDFSAGVIAAVNHDGDSDSTGAVAGNLLGAINGCSAIEEKWKTDLELRDVILKVADDLCRSCRGVDAVCQNPDWLRRYAGAPAPQPAPVFFWHEYEPNGCFSNWYES